MTHFWLFALYFHKNTTFFLLILCHDFSNILSISVTIDLTLASSVCYCMSDNFQPITELLAFLLTKLRNHATSHSLPNRPTFTHAKTDGGYARDHQRAWRAEKSVRDVNKNMSGTEVKPRNSKI